MKNVNVTLRVDEELKKQADDLFSELGLNLTTAFNSIKQEFSFLYRWEMNCIERPIDNNKRACDNQS